jgi:hypothetical protein
MKKLLGMLLLLAVSVTYYSCVEVEEEEPNPYGSGKGQLTFWTQSDLGVGNVNIYVSNQSAGTVSHYHANGVDCGMGDVNLVETAGTYNWKAIGTTGQIWSGIISIEAGKCQKIQLTGSNGGNNGDCNYSLNGNWKRQSGGAVDCPGEVVHFNGSQGSVTFSPNGCRFSVGNVKWKNYNAANCSIEVLFKDQNGGNPYYDIGSVEFRSANEVMIGSVLYKK